MAKFWRALVRVTKIEEDAVWVVVPEWNPEQFVRLPDDLLSNDQLDQLKVGCRFFAQVTTDAKVAADLEFRNVEAIRSPKNVSPSFNAGGDLLETPLRDTGGAPPND